MAACSTVIVQLVFCNVTKVTRVSYPTYKLEDDLSSSASLSYQHMSQKPDDLPGSVSQLAGHSSLESVDLCPSTVHATACHIFFDKTSRLYDILFQVFQESLVTVQQASALILHRHANQKSVLPSLAWKSTACLARSVRRVVPSGPLTGQRDIIRCTMHSIQGQLLRLLSLIPFK